MGDILDDFPEFDIPDAGKFETEEEPGQDTDQEEPYGSDFPDK